jgi:hypothetical protein
MKTCPSCNTQNNIDAKFCPNCGASLEKEEIPKSNKKKLGKGIRSLIGIGAFIAFLAILYLSLFLYMRFYINEKFAFIIGGNNSIKVVDKNTIKEFSFGDLVTCLGIDKNSSLPDGIKKEFEFGTKKIYASINLSGINNGGNLKFVWKYADSGETIFEDSYDYPATGNYFEGYRYSLLSLPEDKDIKNYKLFSEPGNYIVDFYYNGAFVKSTDFTLKEPKPEFTNHVVGNLIDSNTFEPVDARDNYSYKTEELYSAIKITGYFDDSDKFKFDLKKSGSDEILKEYSGRYSDIFNDRSLDQYLYFYLTGPYSDKDIKLPTGQYSVEFYNNETLISQAQFNINAPEVSFGELNISKSVNADQSPVDLTDSFILGNKRICASINVDGATGDDKWKFVWATEDKSRIIKEFEDSYDVNGGEYFNGYESISLYIPEGEPIEGIDIFGYTGDYVVEFYHNDKLIDSKVFEVIDTGIKFGELAMCENVDSNDKPLKVTNEFIYGTKLICASIEINGASLDDTCKFAWKKKDDNKMLKEISSKYAGNWTGSGDKYNGYFAMGLGLSENQKLEDHDILGNPGSYIVEFYHDGYLISTTSFEIKK